MKSLGLIPLRNFAVVDKDRKIYRSAQPLYTYEYKWLQDVLGIKTIVNLREERDTDHRFVQRFGMIEVPFLIKDHHPPSLEQANQFMTLIKEATEPLLFHCEHGRGRTSTFCVLANIALGMSTEEALTEEEHKYHYAFQHRVQKEFLLQNFRHETLRES